MNSDAGSREERGKLLDQWHLPEILSVEAVRVHFRKPVPHADGPKRTESREAIELRVRTSAPFPVRALSPALFIGDVVVNEYSPLEKNLYLFISYEPGRLKRGVPILLGWYGMSGVKKSKTKFKFEVLREETR
jgi:hypothetical protein